jgi:lipopolysaccharide/colanic/teichoic acid biosynthesis glycosyltransferase
VEATSETAGKNRIELKPGITGLAQVNRHKSLTLEDKEKYYLYYLKNYSPLLDLEILLKAIFKI